MNYFDIQNNFLTITSPKHGVEEIIDGLTAHILNSECNHLSIDISVLNVIDATRVASICSVYHFDKYPEGKLEWVVKDALTRSTIKPFSLRTTKLSIKRPILKDFCQPASSKLVAIR